MTLTLWGTDVMPEARVFIFLVSPLHKFDAFSLSLFQRLVRMNREPWLPLWAGANALPAEVQSIFGCAHFELPIDLLRKEAGTCDRAHVRGDPGSYDAQVYIEDGRLGTTVQLGAVPVPVPVYDDGRVPYEFKKMVQLEINENDFELYPHPTLDCRAGHVLDLDVFRGF